MPSKIIELNLPYLWSASNSKVWLFSNCNLQIYQEHFQVSSILRKLLFCLLMVPQAHN